MIYGWLDIPFLALMRNIDFLLTNKIVMNQINSLEKKRKSNIFPHTPHSSTIKTNTKRFFPFYKYKQSISWIKSIESQKEKKHESLQSPISTPNLYHPLIQSSTNTKIPLQKWNLHQHILWSICLPKNPTNIFSTILIKKIITTKEMRNKNLSIQ